MRSRKYQFLQLIEDKIERKKMSWLENIRPWTGTHDVQATIHTARNRKTMENVMANMLWYIERGILLTLKNFRHQAKSSYWHTGECLLPSLYFMRNSILSFLKQLLWNTLELGVLLRWYKLDKFKQNVVNNFILHVSYLHMIVKNML